jgi:hypothetical protein
MDAVVLVVVAVWLMVMMILHDGSWGNGVEGYIETRAEPFLEPSLRTERLRRRRCKSEFVTFDQSLSDDTPSDRCRIKKSWG